MNAQGDPQAASAIGPVVVIVGLPGAGKSTIGRRVAERLDWTFVDLDSEIEASAGAKVREIFAASGEDGFRRIETEALERMLELKDPCIIATGGGVVVRPENRRMLQRASEVIWLSADVEALESRLKPREGSNRSHRPLLDGDLSASLSRLRDERFPLYAEVATISIDTSTKNFDEVVQEVHGAIVRSLRSPHDSGEEKCREGG